MKENSAPSSRSRLLPLVLSGALLALDQASKALVVASIPIGQIRFRLLGDFLWIVHVRNTGAAFSLGADGPAALRAVLLLAVPICLMALLFWAVATRRPILSTGQRWLAAGILGGGLGNIADRIFRSGLGVVDFISVKFYGIFGLERWPTFNIGDSCVVVCAIWLALSIAFGRREGNGN